MSLLSAAIFNYERGRPSSSLLAAARWSWYSFSPALSKSFILAPTLSSSFSSIFAYITKSVLPTCNPIVESRGTSMGSLQRTSVPNLDPESWSKNLPFTYWIWQWFLETLISLTLRSQSWPLPIAYFFCRINYASFKFFGCKMWIMR